MQDILDVQVLTSTVPAQSPVRGPETQELFLAREIVLDMVHDLSSRGVITSEHATTIDVNLRSLFSLHGLKVLTTMLPAMGRAFDALLMLDRRKKEEFVRFIKSPVLQPPADYSVVNAFVHVALPLIGEDLMLNLVHFVLTERITPRHVRAVRELSYLFYKYDYPADEATHTACLDAFKATDAAIRVPDEPVMEPMRRLLHRIFKGFDPVDIMPSHGPGSVSGKETGSDKYNWTALNRELVDVFGYETFVASYTHLSEAWKELVALPELPLSARILLVPKDSRGPRIISCEPKEHQWVQQGLMRRMVEWIERHPLTRNCVHFTDQSINASLALQASKDGSLATLDLSEASDRVGADLVRAIFPKEMVTAMFACRSAVTVLPDGSSVTLNKFAPMGSGLCFPVLACVIYVCLRSVGIYDCHVYGDDVIVSRSNATKAIAALQAVGLKVNLQKSCYSDSLFRESCGCDAFAGADVTPIRIRKRWSSRKHPDTYCAWISYTNSLYFRGYTTAASRLAAALVRIYGPILQNESNAPLTVPSFHFWIPSLPTPPMRFGRKLQRIEALVPTIVAKKTKFGRSDGYTVLEYFSKSGKRRDEPLLAFRRHADGRVSLYTKRKDVMMTRKWVSPHYNALVH
jgi:hypothetical protein